MKKRLFSLLLVAALVLTVAGCGSKGKTTTGSSSNEGGSGSGPAYVEKPITINFWHTFGSGETAEYMEDAVKRFNETNEYGITVNATYIGSYATLRSQLTTSIGAGDNPQVAVLGMTDILASAGVLTDMTPYVERDGVDIDTYDEGSIESMYYEGQLTAMPFLRSITTMYYNVDHFKAAGYDAAPTTVAELEEMCKKVAQTNGSYGLEMLLDMNFYQTALIRSLGADGLVDKDQSDASCLEDGTLLQLFEDWNRWCEEGWCYAPDVSDSTNKMYQMLYSGEISACFASSAVKTTLEKYAAEAGTTIACAPMPTYTGAGGCGGGGDVSIVKANNDEQQQAASWEFVKFLMSDEEVANRSRATGYLPTSTGSAELMKDDFAADADLKALYEARKEISDVISSTVGSEWTTQVGTAFSYVLQDKSMTPQEAIDYLKDMKPTVFY